MNIDAISIGENPPDDFNMIVEVPLGGDPVKYEMDKASGAIFVDRFLHTPMRYPCNYGFIPHTLSDDGDPADVLCIGSTTLVPGSVVRCRPIGVLLMEDESGTDEKILAAPHPKLTPFYDQVKSYSDIPAGQLARITHFFEHYKDLEPNKWVNVKGWQGVDVARELITKAIEQAKKG
ncbi:inorganic diphosphatase [Hyphobacterium sp. HN65]|uniref:Inorganic pyrophosphatase n=1 Tax=Hyphobacterium lacteum TaxID=3116575 RepID=A0ABU7LQR2_9PROT|nr:inorganic diphosphatase [Hyphobacterium sp. HN65]MEE2526243.1 inorganic diphosphatase [Hyphobacterium sp. HN65]